MKLRHLSWIVTVPIALLAVSFAVSNMAAVPLSLWPLPWQLEAPAFALVLVSFLLGFLGGGLVVWFGQHGHRKAERQERTRAARLEKELAELRAKVPQPPTHAFASVRGPAPPSPPAVAPAPTGSAVVPG